MGSKVKKYFDIAASKYDQKSNNGLWNKVRNKELETFSQMVLDIKSTDTVIDLGCGTGFYSSYVKDVMKANVYGIDFCPNMLNEVKNKKIKTIEINLEDVGESQLPKYDWALAMGSLEFVSDLSSLLRALMVSSKSSSKLVILMPRDGLIKKIYNFIHLIWGCPTNNRSSRELINILDKYNYQMIERKNSGLLSQILVFKSVNSL